MPHLRCIKKESSFFERLSVTRYDVKYLNYISPEYLVPGFCFFVFLFFVFFLILSNVVSGIEWYCSYLNKQAFPHFISKKNNKTTVCQTSYFSRFVEFVLTQAYKKYAFKHVNRHAITF